MTEVDYFKLVFSIIYGNGSKSDDIAEVLFKNVILSLRNDCQLFDKKHQNKDKVIASLTKATPESAENTLKVIFKCQFGCAIVIKKQRNQSPIDMYIVAPQEWGSSAHDWKQQGMDYCQPKRSGTYFMPRVAENHITLDAFVIRFKMGLDQGINQLLKLKTQNKSQLKYSAKTIHQACKISLDNAHIITFLKDQPTTSSEKVNNNTEDKKKHYTGEYQNIDITNSQANTSWYVPLAVIMDLISSNFKQDCKQIYQKVIISYLGHSLVKATSTHLEKQSIDSIEEQKEIANFKKCLDFIIEKYKKSISLCNRKKLPNKLEKFMELVKKIQENLNKITNYGLTSKITDKAEVPGQLEFQQPKNVSFLKLQKFQHKEQEIKEAKIQDYPMKVGKRLPFEQLLEIGVNIEQKIIQQKSKWILLVQKTFFQIAQKFALKSGIIDLDIHMRQIQCEFGAPNLCKLVISYETIMLSNPLHFGCGTKSQTLSHIQLIKTIAAIIAFQSVKMNRQKKQSNLNNYRIPIEINQLYEGFESTCYEARKVMKILCGYHNWRKGKTPLFILNEKVNSFEEFGIAVAKDTRSAHFWIDNMKKTLQVQKQNIVNSVHRTSLQEKFEIALKQLGKSSRSYTNSQIKNYQPDVSNMGIVSKYNEKNPWLFAFLENIPVDILGMMKMLYLAQNPKEGTKLNKQNLFTKNIINEELPLQTYSAMPDNYARSYSASNITTDSITVYTSTTSTTMIIFNNFTLATELTANKFQIYNPLFHTQKQNQQWKFKLTYILNRPKESATDREHKLYAYQAEKPKEIDNQDFLAVGNVRSAKYTQLMVLCSNILQRKIISNSYQQKCLLSEEVILHTAGQLLTFDSNIEKQFKQITKLISQFIKVWSFTDVNFCPILGPLFGYLGRQLIDNQLLTNEQQTAVKGSILKLCEKCIDEFNRGEEQLKSKPDQKIQWIQRFITMSAIICFRETTLTINDEKQILILCELVFQLRTCEILSGRQQKPKGLREFQKQLMFSVAKTIYTNIQVMSSLLEKRFDHIEKIIRKMDPSYPQEVQWSKVNLFAFKGVSKSSRDFYQIDLFHGKIFKNGKEISALDSKIKDNPYFQQIFGKQRQFQVFQSHIPNFVRTKDTVNHYFKISQRIGRIFFQFSQDGNEIRHIFQKAGQRQQNEEIWTMVPRQRLKQSKCHIPKIFISEHIAWHSQSRKCMIFRRVKLQQIFNVGMVLHFRSVNQSDYMTLDIGFHITYNGSYDNQDFSILCEKKKSLSKYNSIILRSKQQNLLDINSFKLLSRFQPVEYILQLQNKKGEIEYFLHRYQSKFLLSDDTRLESESYFGYSIDDAEFDNNDSNTLFKKFPCLILKKHSKRPQLLNNHQRICIISDGQPQIGGNINKPQHPIAHIDSYKYEIHDFYGDLRGSTRQSLLHLSSVMLSINDNIRISSIEMTPLDYSIYLLKSCVNNIPFSKRQIAKIDIMVKNLQAPQSIVLMLQALWTCAKSCVNILPFVQENQRSYFYILGEQKLMMCRALYHEKLLKGTLRYGERLEIPLLHILGLKYLRQEQNYSDSSQAELSESQKSNSDSDFQKVEKQKKINYWIGQKKYTTENLLPAIQLIQIDFEKFNLLSDKIKEMWQKKKQENKNQKSNINFPKKINELSTKPNCNPMTKQMIKDMKESYQTFSEEQKRINEIIKSLNQQNITYLKKLVKECSDRASNIVNNIHTMVIEKIKQKTSKRPDYITGERPTLSQLFFTRILCNKGIIKQFLPDLTNSMQKKLLNVIKIWVQLKTRLASFERIKQLLDVSNTGTVDYIALMRQMESPRDAVREKNYWLCYQAQNKMQLWLSQLKTYQNLKNPGDFCQLNMGQGKTQVIIPMMILQSRYGDDKKLPRINLLSSLIEEARGNFFRFLGVTGFQLYGFQLPFTREVHLSSKTIRKNDPSSRRKVLRASQDNIPQIQDLIVTFSTKLYILMTRESRLSEILRYYETHEIDPKVSMEECPLIPKQFQIFDIFDEIDELMNPLKSYIFSIGNTVPLHQEKLRLQVLRVLIESFLKKHLNSLMEQKLVISEETPQLTIKFITQGKYPPGLRLNMSKFTPEKLKIFRKQLAKSTIEQLRNDYFSFYKKLSQEEQEKLVDYIVDPMSNEQKMPQFVRGSWKNQILILRGAIGFGIFQHCLSRRCGVDYGVPGPDHKKQIAVPYDAADIPSKTSQYQHPDLSSILSYCAYYTKGLNETQFTEALNRLLSMSATSKQVQYKSWYLSLSKSTREKIKIKQAQQINVNSKALINQLFLLYRRNRRVISFWLNKCIFPSNLKQYTQSITASAWDFADVTHSVGFSGTKDNRWLYSNQLNWKPCHTPSIKGTDGKMIHLITKFTLDVKLIPQTQDSQWQRFISSALKLKVGCIIDAGALCVGKSLQKQIVPWIAAHTEFQHTIYHGISYCDEYGRWKVYDIESKNSIRRGTSIPDHETFVLFDEARTRGADLKMSSDVIAAISLGPKMTKDKFMQAAGRLRKLGRDQKLIIMATQQIFANLFSINNYQKVSTEISQRTSSVEKRQQLTHQILSWCCNNAIEQNQKLLIQFSKLGWDYIRSKENKKIYIKDINTKLSAMYNHGLQRTTVAKLNQKQIKNLPSRYVTTVAGKYINQKLDLYGANVEKQASSLDDVCQRQVQPQPEVMKSQQDPFSQLNPLAEKQNVPTTSKIPGINVIFDKKFVLSQNFVNTTQQNIFSISQQKNPNQLSELYFVIQNKNTIKAITLREASNYIKNHVLSKYPVENERILFLSSLQIDDELIKTNELQSALVSAKFVSGQENYSQQQMQILLKIFIQSGKQDITKQKYQHLTGSILRRKRVYYKKYFGSSLEKLVITLKNQDPNFKEEEEVQEVSAVENNENENQDTEEKLS